MEHKGNVARRPAVYGRFRSTSVGYDVARQQSSAPRCATSCHNLVFSRLLYVEVFRYMAQRNLRLPDLLAARIAAVSKKSGCTPSAFIRGAIEERLNGANNSHDAEARIAATLERLGHEIRNLGTALQAEFSLLDALARVVLLCVPEPPPAVHAQALAVAKERHQKLLKMAALNMQGDARSTVSNLISHGTRE
jgi:predicted DNA-binding protein